MLRRTHLDYHRRTGQRRARLADRRATAARRRQQLAHQRRVRTASCPRPPRRRRCWRRPSGAARRGAAGRAIGATINEPDFLSAALSTVGVDALLSGLEYVLERAPTVSPDVSRVAEVLRAQAPILRKVRTNRDDSFAAKQLIYEAATIGATGIARALVGRIRSTTILTLWATVNSPARLAPDARPGHQLQVDDASVMLDGERGVTTSRDGVIRVWHLASGQLSHEVDIAGGSGRSHAPADAPSMMTAWPDGPAQMTDTESAERPPLGPEHTALMSAFAVDRDGVRGISGDADGNATIWDLQVGEPLLRLNCRAGLLTRSTSLSTHGRPLLGRSWVTWSCGMSRLDCPCIASRARGLSAHWLLRQAGNGSSSGTIRRSGSTSSPRYLSPHRWRGSLPEAG